MIVRHKIQNINIVNSLINKTSYRILRLRDNISSKLTSCHHFCFFVDEPLGALYQLAEIIADELIPIPWDFGLFWERH